MRKVEVPEKKLFSEIETFSEQIMVSATISKANKTSIFFVEPNTKSNVKYYCDVLLKKMIPKMNKLAKHNEHLFRQGGTRAYTTKLTLEMFKGKKQLRLLESHH